jgi:hypothetical protein
MSDELFFHHFIPLSFGLIGCQATAFFVWLMNRRPRFQPLIGLRSEEPGETWLHYPAGGSLSNDISGYFGDLTGCNRDKDIGAEEDTQMEFSVFESGVSPLKNQPGSGQPMPCSWCSSRRTGLPAKHCVLAFKAVCCSIMLNLI